MMSLFRRRRRRPKLAPFEHPPEAEPAPVRRIVDEGVMIAAAAVRMTLKNRIIVGALRERLDFDRQALIAQARIEFELLATRNDEAAKRFRRHGADGLRPMIDLTGRSVREDELEDRHARIFARTTKVLLEAASDEPTLAAIVEQARTEAWTEIATAITDRIECAAAPCNDPNYEKYRSARLRAFVDIDLASLAYPGEESGYDLGADFFVDR